LVPWCLGGFDLERCGHDAEVCYTMLVKEFVRGSPGRREKVKSILIRLGTAVALLLSGCLGGRAVARYQAEDESPPPQPAQWSFDSDPADGLPQGAVVFSGTWAVRAEPDAPSPPNALCQTGRAEFPALSLGDAVYTDLMMWTRFRPISGRTDQAAGLIFRVQDKDDYYILRANALENNVNFYKYAGGRRSTLKEGHTAVLSGQWQELRVEASGNQLRGFLNGELVVETSDETYQAGQIGLWTKADSVTCFDDVTVGSA